ncbi:MAG: primosomal protein N' [Bacteroidetes bacterium]|nr:primosomal protein N' [Bacteroidota bacterium]HET6245211.1 primosomal protein N' [Bacteroidia bacterium]
MQETLFIDVILPLPVPRLYTYRIPFDSNALIKTGIRVVVQFGPNKLYTGLVRKIHQTPPKEYEAKYIEQILDLNPVVNEKQFVFWEWLSSYYMCNIGEVMNAALPGGLKISSETKVILNPYFGSDYTSLNDKEFLIVEALELNQVLTLDQVSEIIDQKTTYSVIKSLLEKGAIVVEEEIKEKFKPKTETFIRLTETSTKDEFLKELFDGLEKKAPRQLDVLMAILSLGRGEGGSARNVKKSEVLKKAEGAEGAINALVKKGILEVFSRETGRLEMGEAISGYSKKLNEFQQKAYDEITAQFKEKDVVLLHGVTSSGKTEIYIKLIEKTLAQGKQVLYLLPEIALTAQIINRLRNILGDKAGIYHSKYNGNERVEVWQKLIGTKNGLNPKDEEVPGDDQKENAPYSVILGARSALFLPFDNLGLIIVDEEHETSFKQFEPAPRYHARDAAIVLGNFHKADVLLGSATPSIESYYNAQSGKYGFVELMKRFGGMQMPEILVADLTEASRKKLMKSHYSPLLLENISLAMENKEQVILFQNRRGFAPQINCSMCGWIPQCTRCDVSLTYHKNINQLKCHYCGYSHRPPSTCSACGSAEVKMRGFGTEKIEDELSIFFPNAKVGRMDLDTTRGKNSYKQIISDFEEHKIDILVGTQMVTKGLDFDNVGLVGILSADSMLQFPDFRANERSFQLMAQVSGRAGRKNKRGKVVIQAFKPEHPIIKNVIANDYLSMYIWEMMERKNFFYPPFHRLIGFTLRHKDIDVLNQGAKYFGDLLKKQLGNRVLGPEFPTIARIRNLYNKKILVKIEKEASIGTVKSQIQEMQNIFSHHKEFKSVRIITDIDPL